MATLFVALSLSLSLSLSVGLSWPSLCVCALGASTKNAETRCVIFRPARRLAVSIWPRRRTGESRSFVRHSRKLANERQLDSTWLDSARATLGRSRAATTALPPTPTQAQRSQAKQTALINNAKLNTKDCNCAPTKSSLVGRRSYRLACDSVGGAAKHR